MVAVAVLEGLYPFGVRGINILKEAGFKTVSAAALEKSGGNF